MIKEVKMYTVICDGCGIDANAGSEFSCWGEAAFAEEMAIDSDWIETDNKHYCPKCYSFDDEDNLILKTNIHAKSKP